MRPLKTSNGNFTKLQNEHKKKKGRKRKSLFSSMFGRSLFRKRRKLFGLF